MNFFGHATVASWRSQNPEFVLGAMLPDFASMIRARPPRSSHRELDAGIRFHHATDAVFHETPSFRRLSSEAFEDLATRGVARGPARAVAHIGVEILLDNCLAEGEPARRAYLAALAAHADLVPHIAWSHERARHDLAELVAALSARGLDRRHASPEIVAFRVTRALGHRPRLALDAGAQERVRDWAETTAPAVRNALGALLGEIEHGLSHELNRH